MSINEVEIAVNKILEDIESIYTVLVQNRIFSCNKIFYCYLCRMNVKNLCGAICHATREEHKQRNKMCQISNETLQDLELDEEKSVQLVLNGIIIVRFPGFFCNLCLCELPSLNSVTEHVNEFIHKKAKNNQNHNTHSTSTLAFNSSDNTSNSNQTKNKIKCNNTKETINTSSSSSNIPNNAINKTENINCDKRSTIQARNIDSINSNTSSNCNDKSNKTENSINCNDKNTTQTNNKDSIPTTSNGNLSVNGSVTNFAESNKINEIHEDKPITMYSCNLCQIQLLLNDQKYHKMFHLSNQNYSSKYLDIVKFSFKNKNEKCIICLICGHEMKDEMQLHNHLQDITHQRNVLVLKRNYNLKNDDKIANSLLNLNAKGYQDQSNASTTLTATLTYCIFCNISLPYQETGDSYKIHKNRSDHIQNFQNVEKKNDCTLKSNSDYVPILKCFLCDNEFDNEWELWLHYKTDAHLYLITAINILQENSIIFISDENDNGLLCKSCKIRSYDLESMIKHIHGDEHKKASQIHTSITKEENCLPYNKNLSNYCTVSDSVMLLEIRQDKNQMEKTEELDNNIFYSCPICNKKMNGDFYLVEHLQTTNYCTNILRSSSPEKFVFLCPLCNVSFSNDHHFVEHLKSETHTMKYTMLLHGSINIESYNTTINPDIEKNNAKDDLEEFRNIRPAEPEDMDIILSDLISFEPLEETNNLILLDNLSENNLLINSKEDSILIKKYISFCIESGNQNIFNIDINKLQTLQLGISLTFPIDSGRFCIACSKEFSDDFQLSAQHLHDENHLKIVKQLLVRNESVKNCIKDQLTDLDIAKSYMEISSFKSDNVKCFACNVRVEKHNIEKHMALQNHKKNIRPWKELADKIFEEKKIVFCEAWYYAEKFICELCSAVTFSSEKTFTYHLLSEGHLYKVSIAKCLNTKVEYNICGYCVTFWFGKANGYLTHCEGQFHKYLVKSGTYTIPNLSSGVKNILNNFEKTIKELLEECENSDKSIEEDIIQSIKEVARVYYAYAEAFMYGSRKSLTNLKDSACNIYVDPVTAYSSVVSTADSIIFLKNILKNLKEFKDTWRVESTNFQALVPIITLRHIKTNIICDISCTNGLVVEKSKLIRCYAEASPTCRKLILFMTKWMHLCRLSGTSGINSFSTSCLVIYFLQVKGILPSVHELIKLEDDSNVIAGWETGFCKEIHSLKALGKSQQSLNRTDDESTEISNHQIKILLTEFFSFYFNFDYRENIICPFLGKLNVKKKEFTSIDELPKEMKNYKTLLKKGTAELLSIDLPMCVQDPLDLSKNVTTAIGKYQIRQFKEYCSESMNLLLTNVKQKDTQG